MLFLYDEHDNKIGMIKSYKAKKRSHLRGDSF